MDYKENDNELIFLIKEENEEAKERLIKKYNNLINSIVKKYIKYTKNIGVDQKDLYQEGLFGFLEGINRFEEGKNVLFTTYITKCIENKIISFLRTSSTNKNKSLNESISLDDLLEEKTNFYNLIEDFSPSLEEKIILEEEYKELKNKVKEILGEFELKVFEYKIKGYKNEEIANILKKDKRSIENTISRIRKKLKNTVNNF